MAGEQDWDVDKERADQLALLTGVKPGERPGEFVGSVVDDHDEVMFGGAVVGQAIIAMTRDAPEGRRLHSLHAYFLRPTSPRLPIDYVVTPVREGRAYSSRRLSASQAGKVVLEAMGSFTADTEGPVYDLPHTSELPPRDGSVGEVGFGLAGFEAVYLGATEQRPDGTYESTDRKWFRLPIDVGDDIHLHTAYLGMASDWTGMGSHPSKLDWRWFEGGGAPPIASLDHAVWFHRPPRITDWNLLDLHSLVTYGGRGQIRATIRGETGQVVASVAQEVLLR